MQGADFCLPVGRVIRGQMAFRAVFLSSVRVHRHMSVTSSGVVW